MSHLAIKLSLALASLGAIALFEARRRRRNSSIRKRQQLRACLLRAMQSIANDPAWDRTRACVILSGGLDSSIVAEAGSEVLGLSAAFTVLATPSATDRPWAAASAAAAGLRHVVLGPSMEELLQQDLPVAIKVLQSFDPMTLRNEIAVTRALSEAAKLGFTCAVTGDAADELLGGYSFSHALSPERWAHNRGRMAKLMKFGSRAIGRHLGVHVTSPYLDPAFIEAALTFSKDECVRPEPPQASSSPRATGATATGQQLQQPSGSAGPAPATARAGSAAAVRLMGKWPLRLCFPDATSCWRRKDPIEVGCGTTALSTPGWFDGLITDAEYQAEVADALHHGVKLRDKEHLFYYRAFRVAFPDGVVPGKPRHSVDPCPACGYEMSTKDQTFCVTCGHYDPNLRSLPKSS